MHSRTMRQLLIAAFAISATSATLSGQAVPASPPDTIETRRVEKPGVDPRFILRVFPAVAMGAAGAFLGGLAGLAGGGLSTDGSGGFAIATLVGGTLGSAVGAAAPKGRGVCTANVRFWRALAGGSLGLATGIAIVRNGPDHPVWLATIPVGSVMTLMHC